MAGFVFLALISCMWTFLIIFDRPLSCLTALENFNILILFSLLTVIVDDIRLLFISVVVIFTIEVVLSLVAMTRLICSISELDLSIFY